MVRLCDDTRVGPYVVGGYVKKTVLEAVLYGFYMGFKGFIWVLYTYTPTLGGPWCGRG
jgi:hypothetical protein